MLTVSLGFSSGLLVVLDLVVLGLGFVVGDPVGLVDGRRLVVGDASVADELPVVDTEPAVVCEPLSVAVVALDWVVVVTAMLVAPPTATSPPLRSAQPAARTMAHKTTPTKGATEPHRFEPWSQMILICEPPHAATGSYCPTFNRGHSPATDTPV
jgi:hypothetical protein